MEKINLKLHEFYSLEAELSGISNQQTGEVLSKGLLNEKLKLTTKYWMNDLLKKVADVKSDCEKLKQDIIKKHGTEDDKGNISIPFYITNTAEDGSEATVQNPAFIEFQTEFNGLLQETRELEYKQFSIDILDNIDSEGNYPIFFSLLKVNELN